MAAQSRETLKAQAQRESLVDVLPNLASLCLVMLRLWLQETFLPCESWMSLVVRKFFALFLFLSRKYCNVSLLVLLRSHVFNQKNQFNICHIFTVLVKCSHLLGHGYNLTFPSLKEPESPLCSYSTVQKF